MGEAGDVVCVLHWWLTNQDTPYHGAVGGGGARLSFDGWGAHPVISPILAASGLESQPAYLFYLFCKPIPGVDGHLTYPIQGFLFLPSIYYRATGYPQIQVT